MIFTLRLLGMIWTLPNTLFGCFWGLLAVLTGGKANAIEGAIEFHGGVLTSILNLFPMKIRAITFGHSILGIDGPSLDFVREHEQVHVRQYEIWGPFFIPAYLLSSLYLFLIGKRAYLDNPFEKQAYAISDPDNQTCENQDAD